MNQTFIMVGMLAGGLGLFLLAVNMITDGLKMAAGHALRHMLGTWTSSLARGILTGISITSIVQSSSAVTVATVGFVNAGLISMYRALGVVYGSNIGTTMTAWLVAIIGFNLKVEWKNVCLLLSTDTTLSAEQVIESYGLRWSIESMFNQLKLAWGMKEAWQHDCMDAEVK